MKFPPITLQLPSWTDEFIKEDSSDFAALENRMKFVIRLASKNVTNNTGGPFAAAIFNCKTSELLSVGVNVVVKESCCVAHAEIMAIMVAQKRVDNFDLGSSNIETYELVTSTEPCTMCLGAIVWSGIKNLVCAARDEDARAIGFDEGPKPSNWISELHIRGISVMTEVCREEAQNVLKNYNNSGGILYNSCTNPMGR